MGSKGPEALYPYRSDEFAPIRWMCQMSPVLLISGSKGISAIGLDFAFSKRTSLMDVACREKTEKFTPSGVMVAPRGRGRPAFVFHASKCL